MPVAADPPSEADFASVYDRFRLTNGVGLAVSGGADSLSLLISFARWRQEHAPGLSLHVLTVDHGLRPEARNEARFVSELANTLGLHHHILTVKQDALSGNLQAAARRARYALMAAFLEDRNLGHLLVAHHRDDQAETLLMRLARGSGLTGLSAMAASQKIDGWSASIERPLLGFGRANLEAYLRHIGQDWISDPSNEDLRFDRVRLRREMPFLNTLGLTPDRLSETAGRLQRSRDALDLAMRQRLVPHLQRYPGLCFSIEADFFRDQHEEFSYLALRALIQLSSGLSHPAEAGQLEALSGRVSECFALNTAGKWTLAGAIVEVKQGRLWIYREAGRAGLETLHFTGKRCRWDQRFVISTENGFLEGDQILPSSSVLPEVCDPISMRDNCLAMPSSARQVMPLLLRDGACVMVSEGGISSLSSDNSIPMLIPARTDPILASLALE